MQWQEWPDSDDLEDMLQYAEANGLLKSVRKVRLFMCACHLSRCRQLGQGDGDLAAWQGFAPSSEEAQADEQGESSLEAARRWQVSQENPTLTAALMPDLWEMRDEVSRLDKDEEGQAILWWDEADSQANLLRDIFGNPFRPVAVNPAWRTATVVALAESIYAERAFDRMPILADALEEAGCTSADLLNHCRQPGEHVRGCWAVDLVLDKQ